MDLLNPHAGLYPMELLLRKICHRAVVRLCTLPDNHPLRRYIIATKETMAMTHLSPIDYLIANYRLDLEFFKPIGPDTSNPARMHSYKISIAETQDKSMEKESKDNANYKVFTDGSGYDDNAGAVAVIYKKNDDTPFKSLKYHLGDLTEHTTYEAEGIGGILAAHLLKGIEPNIGQNLVTIYMDSQALLMSLNSRQSAPSQYIKILLNDSLENLHQFQIHL